LLLAISDDGDFRFGIIGGTCNRKLFLEFVQELQGDIICDNASIHKKLDMPNVSFVPPYRHARQPNVYMFHLTYSITRTTYIEAYRFELI
jgi:hypothetical protein